MVSYLDVCVWAGRAQLTPFPVRVWCSHYKGSQLLWFPIQSSFWCHSLDGCNALRRFWVAASMTTWVVTFTPSSWICMGRVLPSCVWVFPCTCPYVNEENWLEQCWVCRKSKEHTVHFLSRAPAVGWEQDFLLYFPSWKGWSPSVLQAEGGAFQQTEENSCLPPPNKPILLCLLKNIYSYIASADP